MNLLQASSLLWQQGYLVRVRWDPTLIAYFVELVDRDTPSIIVASTKIRFEEELLSWLVDQLDNLKNEGA